MFNSKTKHISMLTVALTLVALGSSAFAQQTTQNAHTMFLGEGVTKINMVKYVSNPTPVPLGTTGSGAAPGTLGGTNPTWAVSDFGALLATAPGDSTNTAGPHDINDTRYRLSTLGKSSLKGQTLSFEIVAGAIDRCSSVGTPAPPPVPPSFTLPDVPCTANGRNGEINHTGGFTITRGGYASTNPVSPVTGNYQKITVRRIQVVGLTLDFMTGTVSGLAVTSRDWAELHTGTVAGRIDVFNLPAITQRLEEGAVYSGTATSGTGARSSRFDTLWVQDIQVTLHPQAAAALNALFDTTIFKDNMGVGYANFFAVGVPARELPDYRDWVLRY